jgi:hypothetical protein
MTDFDLDRLGELWRKDPEPAEIERMRRSAAAISRRARRAQLADTLGTIVTSIAMLALTILNRNPKTLLVAVAGMLLLLISFVRNRKLREAEIRMLTGTTEEMLDQSIERARSTRKRMRFNLLAAPLMIPVVVLLLSIRGAARGILATKFHIPPGTPWIIAGIVAILLAAMTIGYARSFRRSGEELERLLRLRGAYRRESDDADADDAP